MRRTGQKEKGKQREAYAKQQQVKASGINWVLCLSSIPIGPAGVLTANTEAIRGPVIVCQLTAAY